MSFREKIKPTDNKIGQNKAQYHSFRKAAKILASSFENVSKYEFLTDEDILPATGILEKVAIIKRFEYSP